jgi:FkbM family methyltransferase
MIVRERVKRITPSVILDLYRKIRSTNHHVFKRAKNKKSAKKYTSLILERFPDLQNVAENSFALDLGANIGSFTHACVGLGMSVKSVEPHPIAFKYLRNRTKRFSRVELYQMAVSDQSGFIELYTHPQQKNDPIAASVSASLVSDKFGDNSAYYRVQSVTLNNFFFTGMVYEIVKIDIEGAEMYLVDQLINNSKSIKRLLVETHERFMIGSETSEKYLEQLQKLADYIASNKLEKVWLLDWI